MLFCRADSQTPGLNKKAFALSLNLTSLPFLCLPLRLFYLFSFLFSAALNQKWLSVSRISAWPLLLSLSSRRLHAMTVCINVYYV